MKISDLIKVLEGYKNDWGDIPIMLTDSINDDLLHRNQISLAYSYKTADFDFIEDIHVNIWVEKV